VPEPSSVISFGKPVFTAAELFGHLEK